MDEEISYKSLRKIQQIEKNSPILSELHSSFYDELYKHIQMLDKRLRTESSSQKEILLSEEAENIKKIALNVYEQREKKILLAAVSKARGGNPDLKNMLNVEIKLYTSVLENLEKSRKNILEKKIDKNEKNKKKNNQESEEEPIDENNDNSNPVLLIKQNIPEFIGTDTKSYNLSKNDVVSMPENMCEMLVRRGKAERINC